jgi:hypothetical protein
LARNKICNFTGDKNNFDSVFNSFLPNYSHDLEDNCFYGWIEENKFEIHKKAPFRSIKNLYYECLKGKFLRNGKIKYKICRSPEATILTIISPIIMLLLELIIYISTKDNAMLAISIPIIVLSSFNLYYSKKLRENLYDIFYRIVNEAEWQTRETGDDSVSENQVHKNDKE